MGLPGYRVGSEPTLLAHLTLLPVSFTWESNTKGIAQEAIINVTQRGYRTAYTLHRREFMASLTFRFSDTQYANFQTLHDAVAGAATPFWFVKDSDVIATRYYVRKEPNFQPQAISPARYSGTLEQRWEYTLQLSSEVEDEELED